MKTNKRIQSKLASIGALTLIMSLMVSCGSYQNTSYYSDGVYGNNAENSQNVQNNSDPNYYTNYFKQAGENVEYFTDVENYNSNRNDSLNHNSLQAVGYGGWGDESQSVSVNIYNNGWGYSPYYNYWNGYPSWGLSFGYNWGWGGYYSPWYGGHWGYPYYPNYYYPGHYYPNYRYNNRYVSRSTGQRTGYYNSRSTNHSGRSTLQSNRAYNTSNRAVLPGSTNRRVDPNFSNNRAHIINNSNRSDSRNNNRTNSIRNTRNNSNFSRENNSIRNNNRSFNTTRNQSNSNYRNSPSRSNYSAPSPSRGGNYGGSMRAGSGRTGGGRR